MVGEAASGNGPVGRSIRGGRAVVCEDVLEDPFFRQWRSEAKEFGFRAVISLPLRDGRRAFGVLSLYSASPIKPGPDELNLLQELADNLAAGIRNIRGRVERRRMLGAVQQVAASVSASADPAFFEKIASNMAAALGAQAGFIARLLPEEPASARTIAVVTDGPRWENADFELKGTPCGELVENEDLVVASKVADHFPDAPCLAFMNAQAFVGRRLVNAAGEPIGFLFALFREPLKVSDFIASALHIFAIRVAAELERQEVEVRLREQASLLDKARDAIMVLALDHRILYWNQSAARLYGWTGGESLGRSVAEHLYPDPSPFLAAAEITVARGEWVGEIDQVTKSGERKVVEGHWSLVRDDKGSPKSILAINTDITARRELERQFLRAQRMESIGTLAGGIAHDLNNVLAPIMMSIDLLRNFVSDETGVEVLDMIQVSTRRGAEMVSQVLSFARGVEGHREELRFEPIAKDLARIVRETFPKNIDLGVILQPDLRRISADATQLHQVLLNLCVNARDAMPDGGHIIIKAENQMIDDRFAAMTLNAKPGPYLRIEIEDTGHGIPAEIIDKLFDPFFTTKEIGKGTGLGLSTSLAIVKSHGGFILVDSEPGGGARFGVYLPAIGESVAASHETDAEDCPRGNGETILVVDDESSIRQITRRTLEAFGYRVLLASDGSEAISTYVRNQHEIALVLTDMMMPVMDGPATIHVLRRLNPGLRIIGASGINANGEAPGAGGAGMNRFLPKPFTTGSLLAAIHEELGGNRDA